MLAAVLTGVLMGALHAVFTVALGFSQHVCGIGVTLFSSGLAYFLYRLIFGQQSVPPNIKGFETLPIPLLSDIPVLGPAVFNQFTLVYMAMLAVPLAAFVLYRTPWGLSVRMVGENPRAAEFGRRQRHCHALPGGDPRRRADGRWPAPSCRWRSSTPSPSAWCRGAAGWPSRWSFSAAGTRGVRRGRPCCSPSSMRLQLRLQASGLGHIPYEAFLMLPFIFTIVAMAVMSRNAVAPSALLKPFRREER